MRRIANHNPQFMKLYNQGLSDGKIAVEMGFSKGTVSLYRRKTLGLPSHFTFGYNEIVFSDEVTDKIAEMRFGGASIAVISREFGVDIGLMIKKCREMGLDTSSEAKRWIRRENAILRLWNYLEDHGPTSQRVIEEKLGIPKEFLQEFTVNLMDIFERFKFVIGTGSSSYGGVKHHAHEVYGDLSYRNIGYLISLNDDSRLIDYIAERMPFKLEAPHDVQTLVMHLKGKIGTERARQVARAMGHVYGEDLKETPKGRVLKFTDEQLKELYDKKWNDSEIARVLGVTSSAIGVRRRRLGLPALYARGGKRVQIPYPLGNLDQIERLG